MRLRLMWPAVVVGLSVGLVGSFAVVHLGLKAKRQTAHELRADVLQRVTRLHIAERTPYVVDLASRYADAAVEINGSEVTYIGVLLDAYRVLKLSHRYEEAEELLGKAREVCRHRRSEVECERLRERFLQCRFESSAQAEPPGSPGSPLRHPSASPVEKPKAP